MVAFVCGRGGVGLVGVLRLLEHLEGLEGLRPRKQTLNAYKKLLLRHCCSLVVAFAKLGGLLEGVERLRPGKRQP